MSATNEVVHDQTTVRAPLERLWALSTRVELVQKTLAMKPVAGLTRGHVQLGSRVFWRGWKFGVPTVHHTLITGMEAPHSAARAQDGALELHAEVAGQCVAWFQDRQEKGRFAFFQHDHWLRERTETDGSVVTVLEDEVHFHLPLGLAGRLVARWIMHPYIRGLVRRRFASLTELAQGDGWREWM